MSFTCSPSNTEKITDFPSFLSYASFVDIQYLLDYNTLAWATTSDLGIPEWYHDPVDLKTLMQNNAIINHDNCEQLVDALARLSLLDNSQLRQLQEIWAVSELATK